VNRRALALFGASVVLALVVFHLLRDTAGYMVRNPDGTITGDITHYVYWTRLVTLNGIQAAYGGTWPETYAVYPPVTLYAYAVVGNAYRWLQDPAFDPLRAQDSLSLREGIKFAALIWHLLTGIAIFALVRRWATPGRAAIAGALYLLNPAAIFDVGHWGQPDGAHSLFSVVAVGLITLGQVLAPWAAIALAAMAKPQAWFLIPLLVIATLRSRGLLALARGALVGAAVTVLLALPFLIGGRLGELLSLPGVVSSVMPVVSADAHNAWWLILQARNVDPLHVRDAETFIRPLTFRTTAALLVGAALLLSYWLYWTRRASLAEAAAFGVLGWFTFTTQAHENHLFFALPLLSLAWPTRPSLLVPFAVLSLTLLLNMALHDTFFLEGLGSKVEDPLLVRARFGNAALNVVCWLGWAVAALVRAPDPRRGWDTVRYWPRHSRTRAKAPI
jgi:Gpi18-like mannosyltransferase